jgi:hypothetical protein
LGGDDFAAQTMMIERIGKVLGDRFWEIPSEFAGEILIVREWCMDILLLVVEIWVFEV